MSTLRATHCAACQRLLRATHCAMCGRPLPAQGTGHPRKWCSRACGAKDQRVRAALRELEAKDQRARARGLDELPTKLLQGTTMRSDNSS